MSMIVRNAMPMANPITDYFNAVKQGFNSSKTSVIDDWRYTGIKGTHCNASNLAVVSLFGWFGAALHIMLIKIKDNR